MDIPRGEAIMKHLLGLATALVLGALGLNASAQAPPQQRGSLILLAQNDTPPGKPNSGHRRTTAERVRAAFNRVGATSIGELFADIVLKASADNSDAALKGADEKIDIVNFNAILKKPFDRSFGALSYFGLYRDIEDARETARRPSLPGGEKIDLGKGHWAWVASLPAPRESPGSVIPAGEAVLTVIDVDRYILLSVVKYGETLTVPPEKIGRGALDENYELNEKEQKTSFALRHKLVEEKSKALVGGAKSRAIEIGRILANLDLTGDDEDPDDKAPLSTTPPSGAGPAAPVALDALLALKMSVKLIPVDMNYDVDHVDGVTSRDAVIIAQRRLAQLAKGNQ
jgi:hypothetical protein